MSTTEYKHTQSLSIQRIETQTITHGNQIRSLDLRLITQEDSTAVMLLILGGFHGEVSMYTATTHTQYTQHAHIHT